METYEKIEMEVIAFEEEDVITTSVNSINNIDLPNVDVPISK